MDFILGCNYWASNAGTEMWRQFDADAVEKDLRILTENGVRAIRAFPIWRDFQPVMPIYSTFGSFSHFLRDDESPIEDPCGLDPEMMEHFRVFLDICRKYHLKVIVGLVTGWMSGRLFVPNALQGRDIITDPMSIAFQQLFIRGFVERFKDHPAITAWDLGNECNIMGQIKNRYEALAWTSSVSNAIRVCDSTRPVISGMHMLESGDCENWRIEDQAMFTDVMTTHPYPYWCEGTAIDGLLSVRTTSHATIQTKYYAELAGKPCLAEEIGTMGPMLASDKAAAEFLRLNMFSLWANSAQGVMWWCANDQNKLTSSPYSEQMAEVELGMIDSSFAPKPVLLEMKKFSDFLDSIDFSLPEPETDGICLLTNGQNQWCVGYMAAVLAKQAGLNLKFASALHRLPDAELYLLPSVKSSQFMTRERFNELKQRVRDGATLYLSMDDCIISGFEELTGLHIADSYAYPETVNISFAGEKFAAHTGRTFILEPAGAEILARDEKGNIAAAKHQYGRGNIFILNFPLEADMVQMHNAFDGGREKIYQELFAKAAGKHPLQVHNKNLFVTHHFTQDGFYAVLINHDSSAAVPQLTLDAAYETEKVYYGSLAKIEPQDACVAYFRKKK